MEATQNLKVLLTSLLLNAYLKFNLNSLVVSMRIKK